MDVNTPPGGKYGIFSGTIRYFITQDYVNNRSFVNISNVFIKCEEGLGSFYVLGTISINGSPIWSQSAWGGTAISLSPSPNSVNTGNAGIYVQHAQDGTGSCTLSFNLTFEHMGSSGSGYYYASAASVALPTIPRTSGISVTNATLGGTIDITIDRKSAQYTDTISWSCGNQSGVIADKTTSTYVTWTPPISLSSQAPNANDVTINISCTTFNGNTSIGTSSASSRCAIPSDILPTFEYAINDKNNYSQTYGGFIRGQSIAAVSVDAQGAYGSTISSISVKVGGEQKYGSYLEFQLLFPGAIQVSIDVTDSRNRTVTKSTSITVRDYKDPSSSIISSVRCDEDGEPNQSGEYAKVIFSGTAYGLSVGGVSKNSVKYYLLTRARGTQSWTKAHIPGYDDVFELSSGVYIYHISVDINYEICIAIEDNFGANNSLINTIPVAFAIMDFDKADKSVGIGMRATESSTLNIGIKTKHYGNRITDLGTPEDPYDAATKEYTDSKVSLNLLINPWFQVNQRNVTTWSSGYGVDMWKVVSGSATVTPNGIQLDGTIRQVLEKPLTDTVTASVKMYSGTASATYDNSTRYFDITSSGGIIRAAKLEYGAKSSIIYDNIPSYCDDFVKCQRFVIVTNSNAFSVMGYVQGDGSHARFPYPSQFLIRPNAVSIIAQKIDPNGDNAAVIVDDNRIFNVVTEINSTGSFFVCTLSQSGVPFSPCFLLCGANTNVVFSCEP